MPQLTPTEKKFLALLTDAYNRDDGNISSLEQEALTAVKNIFKASKGDSTAAEAYQAVLGVLNPQYLKTQALLTTAKALEQAATEEKATIDRSITNAEAAKKALTHTQEGLGFLNLTSVADARAKYEAAQSTRNERVRRYEGTKTKLTHSAYSALLASQVLNASIAEVELPNIPTIAQAAGLKKSRQQ